MSALESPFEIRPLDREDVGWVCRFLCEAWGSERVVSRGQVYDASVLPGFVAMQRNGPVGLVTFRRDGAHVEIVTLNSRVERVGIGTGLIGSVQSVAKREGARRIWLVTTNDNTAALRFYQKRGFQLVAIYPNALLESRRLKPEIPLIGLDGIPLRDEIELEMNLD